MKQVQFYFFFYLFLFFLATPGDALEYSWLCIQKLLLGWGTIWDAGGLHSGLS